MSSDWTRKSDELLEARRKIVEKSIEPITIEALRELGEELFPISDDPWRTAYFEFLGKNPSERYYHARAGDRVEVIYCPSRDAGIWMIPGKGVGIIQPRALKTLAEVMKKKR